jgi:hypothetical protein
MLFSLFRINYRGLTANGIKRDGEDSGMVCFKVRGKESL